jgi:hypothetical protein
MDMSFDLDAPDMPFALDASGVWDALKPALLDGVNIADTDCCVSSAASPGCDSSLNAEAAPFEPAAKAIPSAMYDETVGVELDRLLDQIISEASFTRILAPEVCAVVGPSAVPGDAKLVQNPEERLADKDHIIALERRIAAAIERTSRHKSQSGEPWSTVCDERSFLVASRQFFKVACELPRWDPDKLGTALNYRDCIRSGRTMREDQHRVANELHEALAQTKVVEETTDQATWFYLEAKPL